MASDRPNFLLIMSDQHNPRILGCAGDPIVRTPNLDRLAGGGVTLNRNYCATPLCVPSRMAFVTGQHPNDLRIWTNGGSLPSATPTFAHSLSLAEYETVLCGRMHFVGADQRHGFEKRLVGDVSGAMTGSPVPRQMFEGIWNQAGCGQSSKALLDNAVGPGKATYEIYDEDVTKRACDMLAGWGGGVERPFCMVVGFLLPHNPYVCSPDLFDEYMDRLPIRPDWETNDENPAVQALKASRGMESITPEMARRSRAAYYGLVTTLDRNVGRILEALDAAGLRETTATMYTSDHGDLCGEHGLWCKDSFYDGSGRVPTIWSRPGVFGEGTTIEQATSLVDVAPTLTDLAAAEPLPNVRGTSLRALLAGEEASKPHPPVFAETYANAQRPARMVRRGAWKLCHYHGCDQPQLFNMETDPEERCDLGGDDRNAAIRDELHALVLDGWDGEWIERHTAEAVMTRRAAQEAPAGIAEVWDFPVGGNRRAE